MTIMVARLSFASALVLLATTIPAAGQSSRMSQSPVSMDERGRAQLPQQDTISPREGAPRNKRPVTIVPYIEAQQVVSYPLKPGGDPVTYSVLSAGVDGSLNGRNNQATFSLRYERRFGWGKRAADSDSINGVLRGSSAVVPQVLTMDYGALAARNSYDSSGFSTPGSTFGDQVTQVYSVYAGPTLTAKAGDVDIQGSYRLGYNRNEAKSGVPLVIGGQPANLFDDSITHDARLRVATRPGEPLPVGLALGAGYRREDMSNLKQRINDFHVRGEVTVPVAADLFLVGGLGWENVEVSSRDALRDSLGNPVVDSRGRFVIDPALPRRIAYQSDGLIWDAGVLWRPSRRTYLQASVGRRYGSMSYTGAFSYAPDMKSRITLSVYDALNSAGGAMSDALAGLPTQFDPQRNPFSGNLLNCVTPTGQALPGQNPCVGTAFASSRGAVYRARGVSLAVSRTHNNLSYGVGMGYERRKYIAALGSVLAPINGLVDENIWMNASLTAKLDQTSRVAANLYSSWYDSGDPLAGNSTAVGANATYYRQLSRNLSAMGAVGLEGVSRQLLADYWVAQTSVGLRYTF